MTGIGRPTRSGAVAAGLSVVVMSAVPVQASAGTELDGVEPPRTAESVDVGAGADNAYFVEADKVIAGSPDQKDVGSSPSENPIVESRSKVYCSANPTRCEPEPCEGDGTYYWVSVVRADGQRDTAHVCLHERTETQIPQVTSAAVLEAFRRVPLPVSTVSIQPPGGRTLVNFETIYSADAVQFTERVTLLGQEVELEITPRQWTWSFGDGTTLTTNSGGRAWERGVEVSEENYVIHRYARTEEEVPVSVAVTWSARWRTGSGVWRQVGETVTSQGPVTSLEVVEAVPVLVGDG